MSEQASRPFLAQFSTPRVGGEGIPGYYSEGLKMWALDTRNGVAPIIDEDRNLAELTTKTKVNQEADQVDASMSELSTKTSTQIERDDETSFPGVALLEITTKTDAQLERDDNQPTVVGFL